MAGAAGIDQAEGVSVLMEVEGERVTVAAGGFQAGVQVRDIEIAGAGAQEAAEPERLVELPPVGRRVGDVREDPVADAVVRPLLPRLVPPGLRPG